MAYDSESEIRLIFENNSVALKKKLSSHPAATGQYKSEIRWPGEANLRTL